MWSPIKPSMQLWLINACYFYSRWIISLSQAEREPSKKLFMKAVTEPGSSPVLLSECLHTPSLLIIIWPSSTWDWLPPPTVAILTIFPVDFLIFSARARMTSLKFFINVHNCCIKLQFITFLGLMYFDDMKVDHIYMQIEVFILIRANKRRRLLG